jgi:hypothetical protein
MATIRYYIEHTECQLGGKEVQVVYPARVEASAPCDDCIEEGNEKLGPVFVWTTAIEMEYAVCASHLARDDYATLLVPICYQYGQS